MTAVATIATEAIPLFRGRSNGATWIYIIRRPDTGAFKIGRARNVQRRLIGTQTANDVALELIVSWRSTPDAEQRLHALLAPYRKRGEWYLPTVEVLDWVERQRSFVTNNASTATVPGCSCEKCGAPLIYRGRGRPPLRCPVWPDCTSPDVVVYGRYWSVAPPDPAGAP